MRAVPVWPTTRWRGGGARTGALTVIDEHGAAMGAATGTATARAARSDGDGDRTFTFTFTSLGKL